MERQFVENKVIKVIKTKGRGRIIFAEDFIDIGDIGTVNKALSRLKEKKLIKRLAQGIYNYPELDEVIGEILPSIDEIAEAIAKRDRARILPTGVQALNKLGLSTQVPLNIVYLTDGAARSIAVGKQTIKFKKTTPRNLAVKSQISGLIIQALKEIGRNNVLPEELSKIEAHLRKEAKEVIQKDAQLAPVWIRKIMIQAIK